MRSMPVKTALLFALVLVASCGTEERRLIAREGSLILEKGGAGEVLLAAVGQEEARSGAHVRLAHEVVASRDGTRAVARLIAGRAELALPVYLDPGADARFGDAIEIPRDTRVFLSPHGNAFLLVSAKDLYLPKGSSFLLNRGAMLASFERRHRREEIDAALGREGPGPWYGAPERRYVPSAAFEVERIEWTPRGCRLEVIEGDGRRRSVALDPV